MATTLKTTFKFKRGQSTTWASLNPILAAGEPGYELDTHKLKIGDGVTPYNDLPYMNGEGSGSDVNLNIATAEQIKEIFDKEE